MVFLRRLSTFTQHWFSLGALALLLTLADFEAQAVFVEDLYRADVAVPDRSRAERERAFALALQQVFIRLGSSDLVLQKPRIRRIIANARTRVRTYRYRDRQPTKEEPEGGHWLSVEFFGEQLTELFSELGLPLWGQERAETLLWLTVVDEKGARQIRVGDSDPIVGLLQQQSKEKGTPLLFPLLDIDDIAALRVLSGFEGGVHADIAPFIRASQRYEAPAVLVGALRKVSEEQDSWEAEWALLFGGDVVRRWVSDRFPLEDLLSVSWQQISRLLVRRFASSGKNDGGLVELRVDGVASLEDFKAVLDRLGNLLIVEKILPKEVHAEHALFQVKLKDDVLTFHRTLKIETPEFVWPTGQADPATDAPSLNYRYYGSNSNNRTSQQRQ